MAIGNYVHRSYQNYLRYGIGKNSGSKPNPSQIFQNHKKRILNEAKRGGIKNSTSDLEQRLNTYYDIVNGNFSKNSALDNQILENIKEAIAQVLGSRLDGITIDDKTLSSVESSQFAREIVQLRSEMDNETRQKLDAVRREVSTNKWAKSESIKNRMELLNELKENILEGAPQLREKIDALDEYYQKNAEKFKADRFVYSTLGKNEKEGRQFVKDMNTLIDGFYPSSKAIHGYYAEAVVAIVNYMLQSRVGFEANNLIDYSVEAFVKQIQSNKDTRSHKGLVKTNFDLRYADLDKITEGIKSYKIKDDVGIFTANATQDKVDIVFNLDSKNNKTAKLSLKNYNMQGPNDIHLLSGRSVLALVQEYDLFVNHYLNIVSYHPDKEPEGNLLRKAHTAMKLTILLKALMGGVYTKKGVNDKVDVFVINDNSRGRFSVYYFDDIINTIIKSDNNLSLLETGDYDMLYKLGSPSSTFGSSRERINSILAQLHNMKLNVSISKKVFQLLK